MNSKTETERLADVDKAAYDRKQYGFSFSGPIIKDKIHYFVAYEKTDRETSYIVNTDPPPDSDGDLPPIFPALQGTAVPLPFKDDLVTAKVTWQVNPRQLVQLRYGYQKNTGKYGAAPIYTPDSLGTLENKYNSVLVGHQWALSGGALNEFLFQYSKFNNFITSDSTNPSLYFPSGFAAGQNFNTPQSTEQVKYQWKDDFSFGRTIGQDRHDFKVGFNYIHEPTLGGDFSTGVDAPRFEFSDDSLTSPITRIEQRGGKFVNSTPVDQYSVYFQDDWQLNPRLTLNLGLRYDYWDGFDLDQTSNPIWQHLSTQTTYNDSYLQDFQGGRGGKLENDDDNWGPRVGFTYDISGKATTILRGGFGIYYDFPYTNATILFPAGAVQSDYGTIYLNTAPPPGFQVGDPLPPNELTGPGVDAPNEVASPTLATPYSRQYSIGLSHQFNASWGMNVEATVIDYRDLPFRFRFNGIDNDPNSPNFGNLRFPFADSIRLWYGNGEADYEGLNIGVHYRFTNRFMGQGFYTLSKVEGNTLAGADEFRVSDRQYQPGFPRDQVVDFTNPLCSACEGPLNTDARHKVTLAGIYMAPWDLKFSGFLRYRSATPYTRFDGTDVNGDGFATDLAPGEAHVNDERGHDFSQLDLRGSKLFHLGKDMSVELIVDIFNVFNTTNPAGYNSAGEVNYYSGDPLQGEQRLAQIGARFAF